MQHTQASERNANSLKSLSSAVVPEQFRATAFDDSFHSTHGEHCMSTKFDFTSLQTAETEQAAADFAAYQKTLREIASGKCKRSKPEILAVLKAVDRDARMLEEDVRKRSERDEKIAEIDRVGEYESETKTLAEEQKVRDEEFRKIEEKYRKKDWELQCRIDGFKQKIRTINTFRRELLEGCDDLNLILRREEMQQQLQDPEEGYLYQMQRRLGDEIGEVERALMNLTVTQDYTERRRELKARAKELRARYEEGELKKLEFKQQEDNRRAAIREVEERMIRS